jgi:hypothetical protein
MSVVCDGCRGVIPPNIPRVTQDTPTGMRLDWHTQCWAKYERKAENSNPTDKASDVVSGHSPDLPG